MDDKIASLQNIFSEFDRGFLEDILTQCNGDLEKALICISEMSNNSSESKFDELREKYSEDAIDSDTLRMLINEYQESEEELDKIISSILQLNDKEPDDLDILCSIFPSIERSSIERLLTRVGDIGSTAEELLNFGPENNVEDNTQSADNKVTVDPEIFKCIRRKYTQDEITDENIEFFMAISDDMDIIMDNIDEFVNDQKDDSDVMLDNESALTFIKSIYPDLDEDSIKTSLAEHENDLDSAICDIMNKQTIQELNLKPDDQNSKILLSTTHQIPFQYNPYSGTQNISTTIKINKLKIEFPSLKYKLLSDILQTLGGDIDQTRKYINTNIEIPPQIQKSETLKVIDNEKLIYDNVDHYQEFRQYIAEANSKLGKAQELGHKAAVYFKNGHRGTGAHFGSKANSLDIEATKLYEQAAKSFVLSGSRVLDFHGMPCKGARSLMSTIIDIIQRNQLKNRVRLKLITGKGLHSQNRIPVIKNEIIRLLKSKNVNYQLCANKGVVMALI